MDNEASGAEIASEKMLPQSQVNELIGGAKAIAADKAARETEAKYQQKLSEYEEKLKTVASFDEDAMYSKFKERQRNESAAEEKARQQADVDQQFKEISGRYFAKLNAAKDITPDFDELMRKFPHAQRQAIIIGAADLPNTAEVVRELALDRVEAYKLNEMAATDWEGFMDEMHKRSKEIEERGSSNSNKQKAQPPLSRLKSDVVGINKGKLGLNDFKDKKYRIT